MLNQHSADNRIEINFSSIYLRDIGIFDIKCLMGGSLLFLAHVSRVSVVLLPSSVVNNLL